MDPRNLAVIDSAVSKSVVPCSAPSLSSMSFASMTVSLLETLHLFTSADQNIYRLRSQPRHPLVSSIVDVSEYLASMLAQLPIARPLLSFASSDYREVGTPVARATPSCVKTTRCLSNMNLHELSRNAKELNTPSKVPRAKKGHVPSSLSKFVVNARDLPASPALRRLSTSGQSSRKTRLQSQSTPSFTDTHKHHSFVCNLEETLLSGGLPYALPVCVTGFSIKIDGTSSSNHPKQIVLPMTVFFFESETPGDTGAEQLPYVGFVDIHRIPAVHSHEKTSLPISKSGVLCISILNPLNFSVKKFHVKYDLHDMPHNHCVFIRQRCTSVDGSRLRYAIQLRMKTSSTGRLAVSHEVRVVFAWSMEDEDSVGQTVTVTSDISGVAGLKDALLPQCSSSTSYADVHSGQRSHFMARYSSSDGESDHSDTEPDDSSCLGGGF